MKTRPTRLKSYFLRRVNRIRDTIILDFEEIEEILYPYFQDDELKTLSSDSLISIEEALSQNLGFDFGGFVEHIFSTSEPKCLIN